RAATARGACGLGELLQLDQHGGLLPAGLGVRAAVVGAAGAEGAAAARRGVWAARVLVGLDVVGHLAHAGGAGDVADPGRDHRAGAPAGAGVAPGALLVGDGGRGAVVAPEVGRDGFGVDLDRMILGAELGAVFGVALAVAG